MSSDSARTLPLHEAPGAPERIVATYLALLNMRHPQHPTLDTPRPTP